MRACFSSWRRCHCPHSPPHAATMHAASLLAGIRGAAPTAQYVLCLDDDVQLHPGALASLVADMEADPSLFMATGGIGQGCTPPPSRAAAAAGCSLGEARAARPACCSHPRASHPPPLLGYPFDVPPHGAGLLAYAVLSYHLPLVIPFSVRQRTQFVWGGCMLFRAAEVQGDARGILKVRG